MIIKFRTCLSKARLVCEFNTKLVQWCGWEWVGRRVVRMVMFFVVKNSAQRVS